MRGPPKPPHQPTTPAEAFVAALDKRQTLGLDEVMHSDKFYNVRVEMWLFEIKVRNSLVFNSSRLHSQGYICQGKDEPVFHNPPTYELYLHLEPLRPMRRLTVKIDTWEGDSYLSDAPTWIAWLKDEALPAPCNNPLDRLGLDICIQTSVRSSANCGAFSTLTGFCICTCLCKTTFGSVAECTDGCAPPAFAFGLYSCHGRIVRSASL